MKGGYQIIDLGGVALASTISGLNAKIKNANGKPIILTNFKISTTLYPDMYMCNYVAGASSAYILSFVVSNTLYKVTVSSADAITLASGTISVS